MSASLRPPFQMPIRSDGAPLVVAARSQTGSSTMLHLPLRLRPSTLGIPGAARAVGPSKDGDAISGITTARVAPTSRKRVAGEGLINSIGASKRGPLRARPVAMAAGSIAITGSIPLPVSSPSGRSKRHEGAWGLASGSVVAHGTSTGGPASHLSLRQSSLAVEGSASPRANKQPSPRRTTT